MLVLATAFWALFIFIILGIVWLVRRLFGLDDANSAAKMLKRRYAAGEISKEQYEEMNRELI